MSGPRFSIVIPTRCLRDDQLTLEGTLRTCLAQEFDGFEVVVSDNWSTPATEELVARLSDPRIRYVKPPRPLAMTDSWEFAVEQAAGEFITVLGDNDGLLLHALPELDSLLRRLKAPMLRWEPVCYNWPDLPEQPFADANKLLIPLKQTAEAYNPVLKRNSGGMMLAAAHSEISYGQVPMIYCSVIHRNLIEEIRRRDGRVFRSACPDVYSAFTFASLGPFYYSLDAPLSTNGVSAKSNGVAVHYLKGESEIADDYRRLNQESEHFWHPSIPHLPIMATAIADAFLHAREHHFPQEKRLQLDRRRLIDVCFRELEGCDTGEWRHAAAAMRKSLEDDPSLMEWFDANRASKPVPQVSHTGNLKRYGANYLYLEASDFGVSDVFGVAELCEKLLGYRSEGINAHIKPEPAPLIETQTQLEHELEVESRRNGKLVEELKKTQAQLRQLQDARWWRHPKKLFQRKFSAIPEQEE